MNKLSKEIVDHVNLIINKEIEKYKKLLKNTKKNSENQTQYDMAHIVYADKIDFLQDIRLKLLTESIEDELGENLDHYAILGGSLVFPNWDFLREHEEIIDIIYKKFEFLAVVERHRKLTLRDHISVFIKHGEIIKELLVTIDQVNTYTIDLHKEFTCHIEEIIVVDSCPEVDLVIN